MSYFDQADNSYFAAQGFTRAFAVTPMIADIRAIGTLYGLSTITRTGDTTYGFNNNSGRAVFNASLGTITAYTIYDSSGIDTLNYSGFFDNQNISLVQESFSNVGAGIGNVSIGFGTVIENLLSGSGNDTLTGNSADNLINGGGGNDVINGGDGNDTLIGLYGNDTLNGGAGDGDIASYASASAGVTVNLTSGAATSIAANDGALIGSDTLTEIENIIGSDFADVLVGNSVANQITGGTGADTLTGGAAADMFRDTAAGLSGDTITDFATGDRIVISDATLAGFTFNLSRIDADLYRRHADADRRRCGHAGCSGGSRRRRAADDPGRGRSHRRRPQRLQRRRAQRHLVAQCRWADVRLAGQRQRQWRLHPE